MRQMHTVSLPILALLCAPYIYVHHAAAQSELLVTGKDLA